MMDERSENLIKECVRQYDNCRYTASALHFWQKHARAWRTVFLIAPVILGGLGASQIWADLPGAGWKIAASLCTLCAGFFPAIFKALDLDMHMEGITRSAAEFTALRDRFRQAANIGSFAPFEEFKAQFEPLMDRMDAARAAAPPSPEWCFQKAQRKIGAGDMDFDVDAAKPGT